MLVKGKTIVVTGAAQGIGAGLCKKFREEGAANIVMVDINEKSLDEKASQVEGISMRCDVSSKREVLNLVQTIERDIGEIDLFCSNAGIMIPDEEYDNAASASDEAWLRSWNINVMAHVYAAKALLPGWIARGCGYFLNTVSAAGLLNVHGSATYAVTKHAALGFAENLAITHGCHGIKVSVLCPQGVDTPMLHQSGNSNALAKNDGVLTTGELAQHVIEGIEQEKFLVLPHPEVERFFQNKARDYDRWISRMAGLQATLESN